MRQTNRNRKNASPYAPCEGGNLMTGRARASQALVMRRARRLRIETLERRMTMDASLEELIGPQFYAEPIVGPKPPVETAAPQGSTSSDVSPSPSVETTDVAPGFAPEQSTIEAPRHTEAGLTDIDSETRENAGETGTELVAPVAGGSDADKSVGDGAGGISDLGPTTESTIDDSAVDDSKVDDSNVDSPAVTTDPSNPHHGDRDSRSDGGIASPWESVPGAITLHVNEPPSTRTLHTSGIQLPDKNDATSPIQSLGARVTKSSSVSRLQASASRPARSELSLTDQEYFRTDAQRSHSLILSNRLNASAKSWRRMRSGVPTDPRETNGAITLASHQDGNQATANQRQRRVTSHEHSAEPIAPSYAKTSDSSAKGRPRNIVAYASESLVDLAIQSLMAATPGISAVETSSPTGMNQVADAKPLGCVVAAKDGMLGSPRHAGSTQVDGDAKPTHQTLVSNISRIAVLGFVLGHRLSAKSLRGWFRDSPYATKLRWRSEE